MKVKGCINHIYNNAEFRLKARRKFSTRSIMILKRNHENQEKVSCCSRYEYVLAGGRRLGHQRVWGSVARDWQELG